MLCPLPVIELGQADAEVAVGGLVAVAADRRRRAPDVPAWCRMRGQEYVGEEPADDGVAALRGAAASAERRFRCGCTSAAASPP